MTNFVLLHGGGMGGWTWKFMRPLLRQAGHEVFTPTFTGFGERIHLIGRDVTHSMHVTDIVNVLHSEDTDDVVLVAHSYAGTVAPGVVAQTGDQVRAVVCLDSIVAYAGETIATAMHYMPAEAAAGLDATLAGGDGPIGSGVDEQQRAMAAEHPMMMDADRQAWLLAHLSDMPMRCVVSPIAVGAEAMHLPVHYVAAQHTIMTPMHERARALGWTMHTHPGDHAMLVGDPEGTARILLDVAAGLS